MTVFMANSSSAVVFSVFGKVGGKSGRACEGAVVSSVCAMEARGQLAPAALRLEKGCGVYGQRCPLPPDRLDGRKPRLFQLRFLSFWSGHFK